MNRNVALLVGAVLVLGAALATAALVPGVLEEPTEDVRPSHLDLRDDTPIRVVSVPGDTVTLGFDTRIDHDGGPAENVTVELRAVDAETGLLEDSVVEDVGTIDDGREVSIRSNLTVPRSGGYRIETLVYENGERVTKSVREIRGVESLTPEYARSPLVFHSGPGQPAISYSIADASRNRTTLNVSAQITNTGSEPAGDVTVRLRARQAESNVVADQTRMQVDSIRPGRTATVRGTLQVPQDYNYWLDASIVRDDVILHQRSDPANLDPERTIDSEEQVTDVEFDAGEFEETAAPDRDRDREYGSTPTAGEGPGFGAVAALAALLAAALIARRQTNE